MAQSFAPFQSPDRRLKLLWIEDNPDRVGLQESELEYQWGPLFAIDHCSSPEEVSALLPEGRVAVEHGRYSPYYTLTHMPYDVILADFRLSEPPGGQPSAAARASTAGLTIAVLAALHFPDHPVAILPYSAYTEEFGYQYALLQLGCPPSIHVLWDETLHKGSQDKARLLLHITREYRKALRQSLVADLVHVPFQEYVRWQDQQTRDWEGPPSERMLDSTATLQLRTPWGQRNIGLDVLFYDVSTFQPSTGQRLVAAHHLYDWLATIPAPSREERQARLLADSFWRLRRSEQSRFRYYTAESLARGRQFSDLDPAEPPEVCCPWLLPCAPNDATARLAILFLILRELASRVSPAPCEHPISEQAGKLRAQVRELLNTHDHEEITDLLLALDTVIGEEDTLSSLIDEVIEAGPLQALSPMLDSDILRLLDPLPARWDVPLTLDKGQKVGRGLSRLQPALDVKALLRGDGRALLPSEKGCARRYALAVLPTRADWPAWLT